MRKNLTHYLKQLATPLLGACLLAGSAQAQIIFDNGPIFNSPGTGAGGANESVLYTTTFAMGTIGFGQQQTAFNRIADDFLATGCSIRIDSIVLFGYQTNSGPTSTFTNVNLRIWNGVPDAVGSTIVFGDTTTNRLIRTAWSGVYRITETTTGSTTRPIMRNVLNVGGINLAGGNYWLDWSSAGSSASGPWAPPRTPVGVAITGNGRQRTGSTWNNAVDGGTGTPAQGFPFLIYGAILDPTVDAGADQTACPGSTLTLGGSPAASGGTMPYTYSWSPSAGLSNPSIGNPTIVPTGPGSFVLTVVDGGGCTVSDTVNVNVGSVPGSFLPNDTTLCVGATITLTATSGVSYLWSTGDTTQSVTVAPGSYSVVVQDAGGCSATDSIQVNQAVLGSIAGDSTVCPGAFAQLTASPSGATYIWSTGDTSQTISVTAGSYSVTITEAGCGSGASFTVTGLAGAVASFNFNNTNLTYNFTDNSTGGPTSWLWSFGDGNSSVSQNPSHTYAASGNYTVILQVTNACGFDTMSMTLNVVAIENGLPGSTIEVSPVPATNRFSFDVKGLGNEPLTVDLRDLSGRQIAVWNFENPAAGIRQAVETSELARGVYMLRFMTSQGSEVRKIVLE